MFLLNSRNFKMFASQHWYQKKMHCALVNTQPHCGWTRKRQSSFEQPISTKSDGLTDRQTNGQVYTCIQMESYIIIQIDVMMTDILKGPTSCSQNFVLQPSMVS